METTIKWNEGDGYITATYEGSGSGSASISSDVNEGIDREQSIKVETTDKSVSATLVVSQEGLREVFLPSDGLFVLADGGTFNVLKGSNVSETYTRLTHIEATGEQYINTGYVVQEDDVIEIRYISTSDTSVDKALFGCYDNVGSAWVTLYSNTAYVRYGSSESSSVSNAAKRHLLKIQRGSVDVDGDKVTLAENNMPEVPLYLFARNGRNEGANMYGIFICLGFTISKTDGEKVMDLRPCKRNSDDKVGMLDLVGGGFFTNQGTSEDFLYGSEVRVGDDYELMEYVSFDQDKMFSSVVIDSAYMIESLWSRDNTSNAQYMYGFITSPHTTTISAYVSSTGTWRWGNQGSSMSFNDKYIHHTKQWNGNIFYDGVTRAYTKSSAFTTSDTLIVGGRRGSDGVTLSTFSGKMFFLRILDGGEPVIDWMPCRRLSDGVEGFWDCVTQSFVEPI